LPIRICLITVSITPDMAAPLRAVLLFTAYGSRALNDGCGLPGADVGSVDYTLRIVPRFERSVLCLPFIAHGLHPNAPFARILH